MSGGTQTHSLRLKIDAGAAKSGSREFVGALKSIKLAVRDLERDSTGAFANLKKGLNTSGDGAKTSLDQTAKAASRTEQQAQRLATSVKTSMLTATGQASKLRAQFEAMGNTSGIQRVEAALAKLQSRAKQAGTSADLGSAKADYRASVTGLQAEAAAQAHATAAEAKRVTQMDALRKRHDELFAVSKRYESSLAEIAQLEARGTLSAEKATAARARAAAQLQAGAVATGKYGQALRVSQHNVANFSNEIVSLTRSSRRFDMRQVAMQLSQVGQQGSVTGNYLQALMIQLPDLALGFGPIGIVAGAVAGVLGTTLVGAMGSTEEKTKTLTSSVGDVETAIQNLSLDSMAEKYGKVTESVRNLTQAQSELAFFNAESDLRSAAESLTETSFFSTFASGAAGEMRQLQYNLSLTMGAAGDLHRELQNAMNAETPREAANSYENARQILVKTAGTTAEMTAEQHAFYGELLNSEEAARRLAKLAGDIGSETAASANEAARLADELNRVSQANRVDATTNSGGRGTINRWNYKEQTGTRVTMADVARMEREQEQASRKSAGGGGRSSGSKASDIDQVTQRLREQNRAYELLASGVVQTEMAARLLAEAQLDGTLDASKESAIQAADAMSKTNEELSKIVSRSGKVTIADATESGVRSGLKSALQNAAEGDFQGFAQALSESVYSSLTNALSDALVDSLFAKETANSGGFLSGLMGLFGAGSEGGISGSLPGSQAMPIAAFRNAPHYSEGTANTSNGIPSILHPNEAVVPLSRGRKIPVDIGKGGGVSIGDTNVTVNVEGSEDSQEQAIAIAKKIEETLTGIVDTRIAEGMQYGGAMNPRGGL